MLPDTDSRGSPPVTPVSPHTGRTTVVSQSQSVYLYRAIYNNGFLIQDSLLWVQRLSRVPYAGFLTARYRSETIPLLYFKKLSLKYSPVLKISLLRALVATAWNKLDELERLSKSLYVELTSISFDFQIVTSSSVDSNFRILLKYLSILSHSLLLAFVL